MPTSRQDKTVLGLALSVLMVLGALIFNEFQSEAYMGSNPRVGLLSFRYRIAQRRSQNSMIWSDASQNSIIFNHDSIRTDSNSEAVIQIDEGPRIELDPNSMVVIHIAEDQKQIEIKEGSVLLHDTSNSGYQYSLDNLTIDSIQSNMRILRQSSGQYLFSGEGFQIQSAGKTEVIGANTVLKYEKGQLQKQQPTIKILAPGSNERFFSTKQVMDVVFKWEAPNRSARLILAGDPDLKKVLRNATIQSGARLALQEGIYYFQLQSGDQKSIISKFRIIDIPAIKLYAPTKSSFEEQDWIQFAWQKSQLARSYELQIATDQNFNDIYFERTSSRNSLSTNLPVGQYYWRLRGLGTTADATTSWLSGSLIVQASTATKQDPSQEQETENSSGDSLANRQTRPGTDTKAEVPETTTNSSSTVKNENTAKPITLVLQYPRRSMVLDMSKRNSIPFRWVSSGSDFEIRFYSMKNGKKLLAQKRLTSKAYNFSDLSKLDVGQFYWEVLVYKGDQVVKKATSRFQITLSQQLEQPELEL